MGPYHRVVGRKEGSFVSRGSNCVQVSWLVTGLVAVDANSWAGLIIRKVFVLPGVVVLWPLRVGL